MRKVHKQVGAMALAVIMAMTSVASPVSAKTTTSQEKARLKNTKEASYKEGEAVVLYYGASSSTWNVKGESTFGDGITIEETYEFTPGSGAKARGSVSVAQELLVSKVSSKNHSTEQLIDKLHKQANVEYAEPNYIYQATGQQNRATYAPYQWALENNGQNGGTKGCDINVSSAWEKKTGTEKVIAIIDSGVDYTHPDLKDNMWVNPYTDQLKGIHGYDFFNKDDDPMDDNQHGTHCAGIITGSANGISGVNQSAKIMALKFLGSWGSGDLAGAIGAYDYLNRAIDLGVNVVAVNNSWMGSGSSKIMERLINIVGEKGCISVIAAGNDATNVDWEEDHYWNMDSEYTIRVAASNENDELASFSNYGGNTIDLAAPGTNILSSVCYDTYNPSIHIGDSEYSQFLDTFEKKEDVENYLCQKPKEDGSVELTIGEGEGFGATRNNALHMKVYDPTGGGMYIAYRPIDVPKSATEYYASAMVKTNADQSTCSVVMGVSKISDIENEDPDALSQGLIGTMLAGSGNNYWDMFSANTSMTEFDPNEQYAVWIAASSFGENNIDIQIDNVGFSRKDKAPEAFGKYSFLNGTSMAAPQVTGAVALISEITGQENPISLRNTVANCVREVDCFTYTTKSGGVLDLSALDTHQPVIRQMIADTDSVAIKGSFFGNNKGKVFINDKEIAVKSWNTDQIIIEEKGNRNKKVMVEVVTDRGTSVMDSLYIEYTNKNVQSLGQFYNINPTVVGSDAMKLYGLEKSGSFYSYSKEAGEWKYLEPFDISILDKGMEARENTTYTFDSQLVYANQGFYTIASSDMGYLNLKALVCYDLQTGKWRKVAQLPSSFEHVQYSTLAAYGDKLYLTGGYDTKKLKVLDRVFSLAYETEKAAWKEEAVKIPARFAAAGHVVGDKLVLTLGGDGTMDDDIFDDEYVPVPNNLVFDGTKWTEVKASITAEKSAYLEPDYDTRVPYYTAETAICDGGILYANMDTKEFGSVFTYNVKENKYVAVPCSLHKYMDWGSKLYGAVVEDQFMFLVGNELYYGEHTAKYNLYSVGVKSAFHQVIGDKSVVDGIGYHYPGSRVVIKPNVTKGQYVSKFMVDGKAVKEASYTIPAIHENHKVEVTLGNQIKQVSFEMPEYTATVGKPLTLKLEATTTENKHLTDTTRFMWTVDNKKYATVENGVLTAQKEGEGKKVIVTAKATDGSNKKASVVVRIPENKVKVTKLTINKNKLQLKKNDSYQLHASIQPINASNGYVIWESSKSAVAIVSNSGEIVARNPGKTVITARTIDGSKLSAKCEVEVLPGNVKKLNAKPTTNSITLSWNKIDGVSGYKVYRYDAKAKKDIEIATLNSDKATSIKITKVNGAQQTYKVAPFVNYKEARRLGEKSAITTATAPNTTKVTKVQKKSSNKAEITWSKVAGVSGYEICMATSKNGTYKRVAVEGNAKKTSYRHSSLKKGKTYYYKVRTFKKVGNTRIYGAYSNVKSIKMK